MGPPMINEVTVTGGIDCATVELFYLPNGKWLDASMRGTDAETHYDRNVGVLRMPPVARFALPFSVAAELIAKLIETAADGVEDLKGDTPAILARINDASARIQRALAPPHAPASPSPSEEM